MTDLEHGKNGNEYPKKLINILLNSYGITNIESAKRFMVWDNSNKYSVVRVVTDAIRDFLLPDTDGEDEGVSSDGTHTLETARQILEDPLAFVKKIAEQGRMDSSAYTIVSHGGLNKLEAEEIIKQALTNTKHTRDEVQSILDLVHFADLALKALQNPDKKEETVTVDLGAETVDDEVRQVQKMMEITRPNTNFDGRKN